MAVKLSGSSAKPWIVGSGAGAIQHAGDLCKQDYGKRAPGCAVATASVAASTRDEGQKFAAQSGIFEERTAHDGVEHLAVFLAYTAPGHAKV